MLILTRKLDQGIVISGNILVRVLGVERDRVKIGIDAPIDVPVLRQELLEREGKTFVSNKSERSGKAASPVRAGDENEDG